MQKKLGEALTYLGYALHPIQDIYAHTDTVSRWRGFFWEHITSGLYVDSATVHWNVVNGVVKNRTMSILKDFYYSYSNLISSVEGIV